MTAGALIATAVIEVVSTSVEIAEESKEAKEQANALREHQLEENAVAVQQKSARARQLERTVSAARAQQAARGLSLGSGSFKAIQSNSFNEFAADERVIDLNNQFQQGATNQKISNINTITDANEMGQGFKAAESVASAAGGAEAAGGGKSPVTGINQPGFDNDAKSGIQNAFKGFDQSAFPDAFSYNPKEIERF